MLHGELAKDYGRNTKRIVIGRQKVIQSNSMLVPYLLTVFKMADEQRARDLDQLVNIGLNIQNGLQFFHRIDDLTVSNVGLAAREGDEDTLKQLLALGKYFDFCAMRLYCIMFLCEIWCSKDRHG